MSQQDYINIILQYMNNTIDKYRNEIDEIKNRKFYSTFDEEDYYKMLLAQVKLDVLQDSFHVIREFLHFMQNDKKQ